MLFKLLMAKQYMVYEVIRQTIRVIIEYNYLNCGCWLLSGFENIRGIINSPTTIN